MNLILSPFLRSHKKASFHLCSCDLFFGEILFKISLPNLAYHVNFMSPVTFQISVPFIRETGSYFILSLYIYCYSTLLDVKSQPGGRT